MAKPRLLMLTQRVPYPADRGDRIRALNLLRFLSCRADISLACAAQDAVPSTSREALQQYCREFAYGAIPGWKSALQDIGSLAVGRSASEAHFYSADLMKTVRAWAKKHPFDGIVCYCSSMYSYLHCEELKRTPVIVDLVDVDSRKWLDCAGVSHRPLKWLHTLEAARVAKLEREICARADEVFVISDAERRILQQVAPRADIRVAGNGVDTEYFAPAPPSMIEKHVGCFVGVLNYQPNVDGLRWFAENVWPQVRTQWPDAKLLVIGKSPDAGLAKLISSSPGMELHANVPDVRGYLSRSEFSIAPLRVARGVQNKVLEAMSMQKPVIASSASLQGINAAIGRELLRADTANDWLVCIDRLFSEPSYAREIGEAARRYVLTYHSWESCLDPFGDALDGIMKLDTGPTYGVAKSLEAALP